MSIVKKVRYTIGSLMLTFSLTKGMGIKVWNYGKHLKRKLETLLIQLTPIQVLLTPMNKP
jgi:hypothetical protein